MSTTQPSIWEANPRNNPNAPKVCPTCERVMAHRKDLRGNDDIKANGLFSAYRRHRQRHYDWGSDPRNDGSNHGDPHLATYYDTRRDALWEPEEDDDQPAGDPDEVVGHVFNVDIAYEARARATVVAPTKHRAKEKAKELRAFDAEDLHGNVPEPEITMEVHTDTFKHKDVRRADTDLAERMEGWPW